LAREAVVISCDQRARPQMSVAVSKILVVVKVLMIKVSPVGLEQITIFVSTRPAWGAMNDRLA